MQPTYSLSEIKSLVRSLDHTSIHILEELFLEEQALYTIVEIQVIEKFFTLKKKAGVNNEIKLEFLLSYN